MPPRHGSSEPLVSGFFIHQAADPTPESGAVGKSEERLRQAVRVAELGIFEHDHRSNELYWSPKQREIFGFGPDEATSLEAFLTTVHPDDIAFVTEAVRQAHNPLGDGRYDIEHRIVRRDGEVRWVLTRSQTFFTHDGSRRNPCAPWVPWSTSPSANSPTRNASEQRPPCARVSGGFDPCSKKTRSSSHW